MIPVQTTNIGDRIECSGDFGTIKYIGAVDGYPGSWLGIDWDDSERGKHNGTVKGIHYFTASYKKSGSFVRPEKVHFGQSAITAITSRYGQKEDDITARINEQQLLSVQQTINAPFLKLVGFDKIANKQSNFQDLQVINLRLQNVNSGGDPSEIRELCPNIMELDISKNLLRSWQTVFDICLQLHQLNWLNVSENRLFIPEDYKQHKFPNVRTLVCGTMCLEWTDVIKLSSVFCNVEELVVPKNDIIALDTLEDNEFKSLKSLDLESNSLNEWSEICKLAVIPTLEHLNLENTGIKSIRFSSNEHEHFANLKKLTISSNCINDWESIGELNKLQNLEELKFLKNPILETENYATCFQLIVARISSLKVLNGSAIKPDERKGAEYDYVKKHCLEWLSVKDDETKRNTFLIKHNRYEEFLFKYGTPEESELVVQSKLIKVSLIEIQIVYDDRIVKKKLPPSILIQKLIMLVQRLFNLSVRPRLIYICSAESDIEIELSDECKELGYYSVQDDDKIIVAT